MKTKNELAKEYASNTVFVDETGNDEAIIYNMRFMAYLAGYNECDNLVQLIKRFCMSRANENISNDAKAVCETILDFVGRE